MSAILVFIIKNKRLKSIVFLNIEIHSVIDQSTFDIFKKQRRGIYWKLLQNY